MDGVVLVLNQNYEPLNVCNLPRAFRLVFGAKAEVIEYDHQRSGRRAASSARRRVIRLQHQIRRPRPRVKLTRREIFARDRPHLPVLRPAGQRPDARPRHPPPPRRRRTRWENLVAACKPCNHRKGGQTPDEARLRLLRPPFEPRSDLYSLFTPYLADDAERGLARLPLPRPELTPAPAPASTDHEPPIARPPDGPLAARIPGPVQALLDHPPAGGPGGLRRRRLAAGRRCSGATPRDWDLATDARPEQVSGPLPRGASTRTASGPSPSAATATCSRSRPSAGARLRRLPAAAPGRVRRRRSRPTSRGATSRSTRWPGARAAGGRGRTAWSTRSAAAATSAATARCAVGDPDARFREDALRMVRAVRLAAPLEFDDRARPPSPRSRAKRRARRPPVRRADRRRSSRSCWRRRRPSIGLRLAQADRPARRDLAGARRPARASPRTRSPARTSGTTRCGPWTPPRATGRSSGWPPSSTTSASRRRSPTVTSTTTTRSAPTSPTPCCAGCGSRAAADERVVHLVRHHMFGATPTPGATRRSAGSSSGSGRGPRRRCSRLRGRTTSAAARRPMPPGWPSFRARIDAELDGEAVLDRSALAIDGDDLMRELGPRARPAARARDRRAASSACWTTRASTSAADAPAARTGHACGHGRDADRDRAAAPGGAGPGAGPRRPGGAPVPPGRRGRSAQLDRGRRARARRARAGRRGRRATSSPERPW